MLFHFGLGLGLAVMLNRSFRGRGFYRVALILPWAVPSFVAAFAWRFIFDERFGVVNGALRAVVPPDQLAYALVRLGESFLYSDVVADRPPDIDSANTLECALIEAGRV